MRTSVGLAASLVVCMLLGLSSCTKAWHSEAIEGRVVDESTGAPIADAVVLLNWQIKGVEDWPHGQLAIFERVTDAHGRFQIAHILIVRTRAASSFRFQNREEERTLSWL